MYKTNDKLSVLVRTANNEELQIKGRFLKETGEYVILNHVSGVLYGTTLDDSEVVIYKENIVLISILEKI